MLYATFKTVQYGNITELYQAEKGLSGMDIFPEVMHNYSFPTSVVTRSDWNAAAHSVFTVTSDVGILRQAKRKIHNRWDSSH